MENLWMVVVRSKKRRHDVESEHLDWTTVNRESLSVRDAVDEHVVTQNKLIHRVENMENLIQCNNEELQ